MTVAIHVHESMNVAKNPILLLKLGSTFPTLAREHGDFEHWIAQRLGGDSGQIVVADPRQATLPDPENFSAVILTGSHSMVTDREAWSEQTARWIPSVIQHNKPLLGICYGHQLIAHALGGEVGPNPRGREFGTVRITTRDAAASDPLFADLPAGFLAHACHTQSVLQLPPGAVGLASSRLDPHQAYRLGQTTWCIQFHPEFPETAMQTYLDECAVELRAQGQDPQQLRASVCPTPWSESLLKKFATLARISGTVRGFRR
jgi:GMP synthase (glutamine-hydrolysing)